MMSEDQQKQLLEQLVHYSLPTAQLVSFSMTAPLALFTPMEVNLEIKVPNAAPKTGDYQLALTGFGDATLAIDGQNAATMQGADGETSTRAYSAS